MKITLTKAQLNLLSVAFTPFKQEFLKLSVKGNVATFLTNDLDIVAKVTIDLNVANQDFEVCIQKKIIDNLNKVLTSGEIILDFKESGDYFSEVKATFANENIRIGLPYTDFECDLNLDKSSVDYRFFEVSDLNSAINAINATITGQAQQLPCISVAGGVMTFGSVSCIAQYSLESSLQDFKINAEARHYLKTLATIAILKDDEKQAKGNVSVAILRDAEQLEYVEFAMGNVSYTMRNQTVMLPNLSNVINANIINSASIDSASIQFSLKCLKIPMFNDDLGVDINLNPRELTLSIIDLEGRDSYSNIPTIASNDNQVRCHISIKTILQVIPNLSQVAEYNICGNNDVVTQITIKGQNVSYYLSSFVNE